MKQLLFITWDGPETSYLQGLFLSFFKELKKKDFNVKVLQLTWAESKTINTIKSNLESEDIIYQPVYINKRLPLHLGFVVAIIKAVLQINRFRKLNNDVYLMPRSIIPALICLLSFGNEKNTKIIYDSDGFPEDERVEFQNWKVTGFAYRFYRLTEFKIFHKAKFIITRSEHAKEVIIARAGSGFDANKVQVIWNGRDETLFTPSSQTEKDKLKEEHGIPLSAPVLIYVGSLGENYRIKDLLLLFNYAHQKIGAKIIIVTKQINYVKTYAEKIGISVEDFLIKAVNAEVVNQYINMADAGISFRRKTFSTKAIFPIKIAEYLLAGVPVVMSEGIGDCNEVAHEQNGIFLAKEYTFSEFDLILEWVLEIRMNKDISAENRKFALKYLTTSVAVNKILECMIKDASDA